MFSDSRLACDDGTTDIAFDEGTDVTIEVTFVVIVVGVDMFKDSGSTTTVNDGRSGIERSEYDLEGVLVLTIREVDFEIADRIPQLERSWKLLIGDCT